MIAPFRRWMKWSLVEDGRLCETFAKILFICYNVYRKLIRHSTAISSCNSWLLTNGVLKMYHWCSMASISVFQTEGRGSNPLWYSNYGALVQLARMSDCLSEGHGFESRTHRQSSCMGEYEIKPMTRRRMEMPYSSIWYGAVTQLGECYPCSNNLQYG